MGDKATLGERVEPLLINPDVIEKIDIFNLEGHLRYTIPNTKDTQKSLQIYASVTNNESMLTCEGAQKGLDIYGEELLEDAHANPGKHPSMDFLEYIVNLKGPMHSHVVTPYSAKPIPEHVRVAMPKIAKDFGTPIHVYDEDGILATCRDFNSAFSWNKSYKNFFAVKACPNPSLMEIMLAEGFGADCSSAPELRLAEEVGMLGENMMFTSNDTDDSEFRDAKSRGAIINLDDITHIKAFERATGGLPELVCLRYTGEGENSIIGNADERKYGLTREQMFEAVKILKQKGVKRTALHTMMASNERNLGKLLQQADIMCKLEVDLRKATGAVSEFINFGGGVGTSYKPWDRDPSLNGYGEGVRLLFEKYFGAKGVQPKVFTECGRAITGPHGFLLMKVRHVMQKLRTYIGVDATMADLMRPGMYEAYHHETVLGKENAPHDRIVDVSGSLCENNDKLRVWNNPS